MRHKTPAYENAKGTKLFGLTVNSTSGIVRHGIGRLILKAYFVPGEFSTCATRSAGLPLSEASLRCTRPGRGSRKSTQEETTKWRVTTKQGETDMLRVRGDGAVSLTAVLGPNLVLGMSNTKVAPVLTSNMTLTNLCTPRTIKRRQRAFVGHFVLKEIAQVPSSFS